MMITNEFRKRLALECNKKRLRKSNQNKCNFDRRTILRDTDAITCPGISPQGEKYDKDDK